MNSSFPERALIVSPTLASTIGLEEAVMLQSLSDYLALQDKVSLSGHTDLGFVSVESALLARMFPFWKDIDIERIQASLVNLGLIVVQANPATQTATFIALNEPSPGAAPASTNVTALAGKRPAAPRGAATLIPPNWAPDESWVKQCKQHNIPEEFIHGQVAEFVNYWRERGQARFSWGNAFYKHVRSRWQEEQSRRGAFEASSQMSAGWQPSDDALEILINADVSPQFIQDAIPEFVLYWRERGIVNGAWNTRFIEHIRKQWAKYQASFGMDDVPRPIAPDWQPSMECYEILQLAEIDESFARAKVPEFVLYWRDSQQARASWNTTFLQFIKQEWARNLKTGHEQGQASEGHQLIDQSTREKVEERLKQLADRSWAD